MSAKSATARKRLHPPKLSPLERSVYILLLLLINLNAPISVQRLDLSNEFTQPLPSPEYLPIYFPPSNHVNYRNIEPNQEVDVVPSYGPLLHPQPNHSRRTRWIESGQVIHTVPTYEPPSPYEEDIYQSRRRPSLRVDPHGMAFFFTI